MFWFSAALLTAVVTATIAWPLFRQGGRTVEGTSADVALYRGQLGELDREIVAGRLEAEDAAIARAEIGRRLLRAGEVARRGARGPGWGTTAGVAVALLVPLGTLATYAAIGAPGEADRPLASRAGETGGGELPRMLAAAEARLAAAPDDGQGWDALAPIYLRLGDAAKAERSYTEAIRLLGESPARLLGLGESRMMGSGGEIDDEARGNFERAAALDPTAVAPRVFLALDLSQERRLEEAAAAWQAVLEDSPPDAPWRPMAEAALDDARRADGPAPAEVAAAASQMPAEERERMIQGMVAGLAARLEVAPDDAAGWSRLIQAYGVLGDRPAGEAALNRAREAFPVDTDGWAQISTAAAAAGFTVRSGARP